ncbi:Glutamate receptor [Forsythia ovata]|uniref:Glutamate receptor n=1 Tax=Forsythia ovata TaxID=205694 RepID=A0ABD1PF33_9LAMI
MMTKGYTWIIADVLTSLLDSVDSKVIDAMQGVIGLKAHIPKSNELENFTRRWRKKFGKRIQTQIDLTSMFMGCRHMIRLQHWQQLWKKLVQLSRGLKNRL